LGQIDRGRERKEVGEEEAEKTKTRKEERRGKVGTCFEG
jgi:hypothetical protein